MTTKVRAAAVAIWLVALPRSGVAAEGRPEPRAAEARASAEAEKPGSVFPGKDWETRRPDEVGLDSETLRRFSDLVGGRGCVVRHGYLVHVWGDAAKRADVASACKPWFTHFLLVAIEAGKVAGVDERVSRWEPGLAGLNPGLGHKDREIAWKHLANQTSCYGVAERPGEAYDYDDYNMALFCDTLFLKVWKTDWTNGVDREGKRHWPDVPTDAYGAFGHGGSRAMVILPGLDLIVAWNDASVDSPEEENRALGLLVRAGAQAPRGR